MNRELKFRAWIPNTGWLAEGFSIAMDGTEWYDDDGHSWPISDLEIMQFTGLHDRNGKEIYEGDIVKCNWGLGILNESGYPLWIKERIQVLEVFYSIHAAGFFIAVDKELSEEKYKDEVMLTKRRAFVFTEVIGNIYENPELLNQKI